ncbi:MAG: hypothetical protein AAGA26_02920 [Pseudomonadota bacterium]
MKVTCDPPIPGTGADIVVLRRSSGPPLRVKATAVFAHRMERIDKPDLVLRLWQCSKSRWAVSIEADGSARCIETAELLETLDAAIDFAERWAAEGGDECPDIHPLDRGQNRQALSILVGEALSDWMQLHHATLHHAFIRTAR